ncbi:unnamed protein product [Amoebophrya sp. A25]|nr:unnamed protein product [Amoebophrya sp. A25]|eukprot:GSA25T00004036001.1
MASTRILSDLALDAYFAPQISSTRHLDQLKKVAEPVFFAHREWTQQNKEIQETLKHVPELGSGADRSKLRRVLDLLRLQFSALSDSYMRFQGLAQNMLSKMDRLALPVERDPVHMPDLVHDTAVEEAEGGDPIEDVAAKNVVEEGDRHVADNAVEEVDGRDDDVADNAVEVDGRRDDDVADNAVVQGAAQEHAVDKAVEQGEGGGDHDLPDNKDVELHVVEGRDQRVDADNAVVEAGDHPEPQPDADEAGDHRDEVMGNDASTGTTEDRGEVANHVDTANAPVGVER